MDLSGPPAENTLQLKHMTPKEDNGKAAEVAKTLVLLQHVYAHYVNIFQWLHKTAWMDAWGISVCDRHNGRIIASISKLQDWKKDEAQTSSMLLLQARVNSLSFMHQLKLYPEMTGIVYARGTPLPTQTLAMAWQSTSPGSWASLVYEIFIMISLTVAF